MGILPAAHPQAGCLRPQCARRAAPWGSDSTEARAEPPSSAL